MVKNKLISIKKAIDLVSKEKKKITKIQKITLKESLGKISAKDIVSPIDLPSLDSAGLDGYVVSAKDKESFAVAKKTVVPGKYENKLNLNYAYKINTGSIIPKGFKNFISIENAFIEKNLLHIKKSIISNKDIKKKSEDLKKGTIILQKNEKINFLKLTLLSSVGIKKVSIYKPLKIGIVSTGNEIVPITNRKKNYQTYDSNKVQIMNYLNYLNVEIKDLGILKDNKKKIEDFFILNQKKFDVIISSGGSSFSSGDLISSFLKKNSKVFFEYLRIQPGRPIIFSKYKSAHIFSLPGNPLAVFINLILIVSQFLINSKKEIPIKYELIKSTFNEYKRKDITKFYRVKVNKGKAYAHNTKGSAKLISIAECDGLLVVNEGVDKLIKNKKYEFIKFEF